MTQKTFQSLLETIMRRNALTQRKLAEKAEISHVSLCRILNNTYAYRPAKVIGKLVDAAGCTKAERVELYHLAGVVLPEIEQAFCGSLEHAVYLETVAEACNQERSGRKRKAK